MNNKTEWVELAISVTEKNADAVANFLIEQGSNGIVEENLKSRKNYVLLKAYLKKDDLLEASVKRIENYLKSLHALEGNEPLTPELNINRIENEDWNKKWKSFFEPLKITDSIVIKPSWRKYWKKQGEIVIELDPGMAFGTGTHPSTRMCLRAIEELAGTFHDKWDVSLLDVGTGSGILAIAASLLGIRKILGIDFDHRAIACAEKNAKKNGVSDYVSLSTSPLKKIDGMFSMVVANILPHILIDMKEELVARLSTDGFLILSGILDKKAGKVASEFSKHLKFFKEIREDEWACLIFQNKDCPRITKQNHKKTNPPPAARLQCG